MYSTYEFFVVVRGLIFYTDSSGEVGFGIRRLIYNLISKTSMLHPPNRDEIVESSKKSIAYAVFGTSMNSREMLNRNFGHRKSMHFG